MSKLLYFNEKAETMSRDELSALQDQRLRHIVAYAMEHNAYFRNRMNAAGLQSAAAFNGMADLHKLPFMSKEDFRREYPLGMCCVEKSTIKEMHMSSGSTGTPVVMAYTENDLDQWAECMARCDGMACAQPGDPCQIKPGFGLFNGGFGCYHGAWKAGLFVIPTGAGNTARQIKLAKDFGTKVMTGVVSYAIRIMELLDQDNAELPDLKIGIFGAETFSASMKKRIQDGLGIEAFDIYGKTETGGIWTLGMDCAAHAGIHPWEDHYIVEIIDPESGAVLPDGKTGEI
ncbi:MAG: AMP-binding protein, partial [Lentisphaeria bacterium]|nr:AMP-binding protein [Lentisphaeria bacterium]